MADQWLRAASLIVADEAGDGIELAGPTKEDVLRISCALLVDLGAQVLQRVGRGGALEVDLVQRSRP